MVGHSYQHIFILTRIVSTQHGYGPYLLGPQLDRMDPAPKLDIIFRGHFGFAYRVRLLFFL